MNYAFKSSKFWFLSGAFSAASLVTAGASAQQLPASSDDPSANAIPAPTTAQELPTIETKSVVNRPLLITSALLFAGS